MFTCTNKYPAYHAGSTQVQNVLKPELLKYDTLTPQYLNTSHIQSLYSIA